MQAGQAPVEFPWGSPIQLTKDKLPILALRTYDKRCSQFKHSYNHENFGLSSCNKIRRII